MVAAKWSASYRAEKVNPTSSKVTSVTMSAPIFVIEVSAMNEVLLTLDRICRYRTEGGFATVSVIGIFHQLIRVSVRPRTKQLATWSLLSNNRQQSCAIILQTADKGVTHFPFASL